MQSRLTERTKRDREVRSVMDSLRRIVQSLRVQDRSVEKRLGLSAAQLFVLSKLAAEPELSLNELAERTHTHQSSVSTVVQRLVERKLVRRTHSRDDARRLELSITKAGNRLVQRGPTAAQERIVAALLGLAPPSRRRLATLLEKVVQQLGLEESAPPMLFEDAADTPESSAAGKAERRRGGRKLAARRVGT